MNWGEIKAQVQQYLENRETSFVNSLTLYARLAEEDIYRQVQLAATRQLSETTLPPDDKYLTVPTGSLSIYSLTVTDPVSGEFVYLLPKDHSYIKEAYPDPAGRGQPRYYAYRDEQVLVVAPTPSVAYGVEMYFFRQPPSIGLNDVATNTNWLSTYGENALLFGILYHGYINEKGDQDVITAYKGQFDKAVADLKTIAEGRQQKDTYRTSDMRVPT